MESIKNRWNSPNRLIIKINQQYGVDLKNREDVTLSLQNISIEKLLDTFDLLYRADKAILDVKQEGESNVLRLVKLAQHFGSKTLLDIFKILNKSTLLQPTSFPKNNNFTKFCGLLEKAAQTNQHHKIVTIYHGCVDSAIIYQSILNDLMNLQFKDEFQQILQNIFDITQHVEYVREQYSGTYDLSYWIQHLCRKPLSTLESIKDLAKTLAQRGLLSVIDLKKVCTFYNEDGIDIRYKLFKKLQRVGLLKKSIITAFNEIADTGYEREIGKNICIHSEHILFHFIPAILMNDSLINLSSLQDILSKILTALQNDNWSPFGRHHALQYGYTVPTWANNTTPLQLQGYCFRVFFQTDIRNFEGFSDVEKWELLNTNLRSITPAAHILEEELAPPPYDSHAPGYYS